MDFRSKSSKISKFLGILYSFDYCPSFLDICLSKILQKFIFNSIPRLCKLQFHLTVCSCLYQFRIFGRFGTSKLEVSNLDLTPTGPLGSRLPKYSKMPIMAEMKAIAENCSRDSPKILGRNF